MASPKQPGTIPVGKVNGRPSASMDATRLRAIERELELSPRERVKKALGLAALRKEMTPRDGLSRGDARSGGKGSS